MDAALAGDTLQAIERYSCISRYYNINHPKRNEPRKTVYIRNKVTDEISCIVGATLAVALVGYFMLSIEVNK